MRGSIPLCSTDCTTVHTVSGIRDTSSYDDDVTKHRPTKEERDERIKLDLPPDEFIEGVLAAGPHQDEDDEDDEDASSNE